MWLTNFFHVLVVMGAIIAIPTGLIGLIVGPAWLTRYHQDLTFVAYVAEFILIAAIIAFFIPATP